MENEPKTGRTYSLEQLINAVNEEYEGLFRVPNSELTIGDKRFFNLLEINHEKNEKVLVLSTLENEQDYLVVGSNQVKWTDNWSGEDERIYRGNVQDQFLISFEEEVFIVNAEGLEFSKRKTSPIFEIDMDTPKEHTDHTSSFELER